jgi:hypothetical protein
LLQQQAGSRGDPQPQNPNAGAIVSSRRGTDGTRHRDCLAIRLGTSQTPGAAVARSLPRYPHPARTASAGMNWSRKPIDRPVATDARPPRPRGGDLPRGMLHIQKLPSRSWHRGRGPIRRCRESVENRDRIAAEAGARCQAEPSESSIPTIRAPRRESQAETYAVPHPSSIAS